jgi:hypothetical protein
MILTAEYFLLCGLWFTVLFFSVTSCVAINSIVYSLQLICLFSPLLWSDLWHVNPTCDCSLLRVTNIVDWYWQCLSTWWNRHRGIHDLTVRIYWSKIPKLHVQVAEGFLWFQASGVNLVWNNHYISRGNWFQDYSYRSMCVHLNDQQSVYLFLSTCRWFSLYRNQDLNKSGTQKAVQVEVNKRYCSFRY